MEAAKSVSDMKVAESVSILRVMELERAAEGPVSVRTAVVRTASMGLDIRAAAVQDEFVVVWVRTIAGYDHMAGMM